MIFRISLALALALLTQNPAPQGVRVSGRVVGVPSGTPPNLIRASMTRQGAPLTQVVTNPVDTDGNFQFPNMTPGQYTLRITGPYITSTVVTVGNADIQDLSVTLSPTFLGHATIEGGGVLPAVLRLEAARVGGGAGRPNITPRGDGPFLVNVPATGDYWLRPTVLPIGYELKSMTFGNVDLLKQPLTATQAPQTPTIEIVLSKTLESHVRVSGRVTGLLAPTGNLLPVRRASIATIRTVTSPQTGKLIDTQYSADVLMSPDGSFEIQGVTPGQYILQAPGVVGKPVEVGTKDIERLDSSAVTGAVLATNLLFKLQGAFPVTPPPETNDSATLEATESGRGPQYIEGALSYVRVVLSNSLIDEKRLERGYASFKLAPGKYEVIAYSRGCSGNCSNPGDPQNECRLQINLTAKETLAVDRVLAGETCTLK
jgi:hypothetical protein